MLKCAGEGNFCMGNATMQMGNTWLCQKPFSQPSLFIFKEGKWFSTSDHLLIIVPFSECGLWKTCCWFRIPVSAGVSTFFPHFPKTLHTSQAFSYQLVWLAIPPSLICDLLKTLLLEISAWECWETVVFFTNWRVTQVFFPLSYCSGCMGFIVTVDKLSKTSFFIAVNL